MLTWYRTMGVLAALTPLAEPSFAQDSSGPDGRALYENHCATCHSVSLRGSAHGAPLSGRAFLGKWADATADGLLTFVASQMPPGDSETLSGNDYRAITRYVIDHNADALTDSPLLGAFTQPDVSADGSDVEWSGSNVIDQLARSAGTFTGTTLTDFKPVTSDDLRSPPPEDWLSWRRTLDGHAHSPLTQINRDNVAQLRLSWALTMGEGSNQITPLVRDGVMFLTHPGNRIQALDAASGTLLWEYRYDYPDGAKLLGGPTRNIALYGDKLFLATYDAAVVAIDARTGTQVWKAEKADYREAYTHSAGPIIADGVVVSGINGCELFTAAGCFITGHDPDTGAELWRTSTLAMPDTEEYGTWGDTDPDLRGGGDNWIAGSYDPDLKLFILGTSQAKPWVAVSRGMSVEDDALYTNSTLALDPKTGEIVWHFQHIGGETIDMEVGFERVLADIDGRKVVLTVGKDGILWQLDRQTGEFIALIETLGQTIFKSVDPNTGQLEYRDDISNIGIGETFTACPGIYGGHNWQASAFDADKARLFLPLHQLCSDMTPREVDLGPGGGGYGADSVTYPMPGKEGKTGRLQAIDVRTMEPLWAVEQSVLYLTGALSTAGDLVFIGDLDRHFRAYDADTGEELWSTRLGAPAHGYPITYEADGRQFVAVPSGIGVFRALTALLYPDVYQPQGGEMLYVFELPRGEH